MGDWQADQTQNVSETEGCSAYCTAYLWVVPAKWKAKWKLPDGELTLKQTFQNVYGDARFAGESVLASCGGDQITFTAGGAQYSGKVNGDTISGDRQNGSGSKDFTANRAAS
jgi:hypothetical protein